MTASSPDIGITGVGVVSPAGWGLPAMLRCLKDNKPIEETVNNDNLSGREFLRREVPAPDKSSSLLRNPRLRRTSPVSRYLAAAAFEALGDKRLEQIASNDFQIGIVVSCYTGCVNFSQRFYHEVLDDPLTASPIIFPETVFNAPSSHLSALIGSSDLNYTLVGDDSQFLSALEVGVNWILDDELDAVLVAAGEESNWLSSDALSIFKEAPVLGEGACALLLERSDNSMAKINLITDRLNYTSTVPRTKTLSAMREQLPEVVGYDILLEGFNEGSLWEDFSGKRLNIREIMGEGFGVSVGWSCAAAAGLIGSGKFNSAIVSGSGMDQSCSTLLLGS